MTKRLTGNNLIIHLVLVSIMAGCTTMQPVYGTDARSLARQIQVGNKINIIRNDESDVTFKVGAVSDEGISGDGVFVAYSDIRQVQISTAKPMNQTLILVIVVAASMLFISSQAGCNSFREVCNE